ncbi:MAG: UvrD-helicase domain-containing protein [Elusimicrobia bacterium]|nr:UvrD-helicase domain-containing protein [Elusimicrobiota bacterium]
MTADRPSRDVARKQLDVNVVVEAGAGTGKTTLLTDRLLFLLLAGGPEREGLSVTRIVALTFTEKAAGEIKLRLADRLNDLLRRLEGRPLAAKRGERTEVWLAEARAEFGATEERLRLMAGDALRDLDRAPIGTIHSFCKTLLQLFPLEAGLNPNFQVDRGDAFEELFEREWGRWLEGELIPGGPAVELWREVLPRVGLGDVATLARALARSSPALLDRTFSADRLAEWRMALERVPVGKPKPRRGKMLESIQRIAERLRAVEQVARDPWGPWPEADDWKEAPKTWPGEWEELEGETVYEDACAVAKAVSPVGEAALARVRKLLSPFLDHCRARYRAAGWMGFDDLLSGARNLLAQHPEVRRELKSRYGAILVDEFQDTDPLQGELLLFLAERAESEAAAWKEVSLAPGKLFIVGDLKQSIYRFRGADIRAYEAFVSLVIAQGGRKCDLQTSFRTHEGIVGPVNRLFTDLMREAPGLQPAYLPLLPRPGGGPDNGGVELAIVPAGSKGEDSSSLGQEAEARWIARWIVDRCGPEGSGRPWRLGDVALLFRSTSALTVYMEALKAARIPYLVESDRAFYGTPEVMDFLNLLRVVQDPADRVSLVGLLRSPMVLLEDRHLLALAEAGRLDDRLLPPEGLPPEVSRTIADFFGVLGQLRAAAQRESLGEVCARLLRETPLLAASAAAYYGEQSVSNLFKLARLAAEAGAARGETLDGFARRLMAAVAEGREEGESSLGEEKVEAVRLLTVHKAKGLEYKVVFLPNLSAKVQGGARHPPALRQDWAEGRVGHRLVQKKWADLEMVFLESDERRREAEESIRLFYVAATRAREQVILVGNEKIALGSFMGMLSGAARRGVGAWEWADGLRLPVTVVSRETGGEPRWPKGESPGKNRLTPSLVRSWEKRKVLGAEIQGRPLFRSPSSKTQESEKIAGGEPSLPSAEAALLGRLCHAVLETWEWGSPTDVSPAVGRTAALLAPEHPAADWARWTEEATGILSAFLQSPVGRSFAQEKILAREAPFLFGEKEGVVRGVIDLLYRRGAALWVADYKTDRVRPGEEKEHARRYAEQGRDYRAAVQKALGEPCGFEVIFLRTGESVVLEEPPLSLEA